MTAWASQTRTEVTAPDGRRFVSLYATDGVYRPEDGYRLWEVRGFDHPSGIGFVVTDTSLLSATVRASVSDQTSMARHQRFRP